MKILRKYLCCCLLALLLGGCAATARQNAASGPATPDALLSADLAVIPQNLSYFAQKANNEAGPLLSSAPLLAYAEAHGGNAQDALAAAAVSNFFSPWQSGYTPAPLNSVMGGLYWLDPEHGYMENLRPFTPERWAALVRNCDVPGYPSRNLAAITVQACALRLMPTSAPYFFNPSRPGQGYPFDYFQNSSLPPGSPVRITHVSQDQAWALVESPTASGWVDARSIALVDEKFMIAWRSRPLAAITQENTALLPHDPARAAPAAPAQIYDNAVFLEPLPLQTTLPQPPTFASIGAILPLEPYAKAFGPLRAHEAALYFPQKNSQGYAEMRQTVLAKDAICPWPMPLTHGNMALLGNRMLNQPYGWGGYDGNRDCSATLRDLFLPFGLWLPRNSRSQSATGGFTDISKLDAEAKEAFILQNGVPFISLIGMPGHIALYIGEYQGRAVMFHNMWGLRINQTGTAIQGRAVIGKAVITTLSPGRERGDIALPNSLLDAMDKLTIPLATKE